MLKNTQEIYDGIKSYHHEIKILKRIIRKHKGLTQDHFEVIFKLRNMLDKRIVKYFCYNAESFILGSFSSRNVHAKWLHLLQYLTALNIIYARYYKMGKIKYYLTPEKETINLTF
jgi:hypothetical protein